MAERAVAEAPSDGTGRTSRGWCNVRSVTGPDATARRSREGRMASSTHQTSRNFAIAQTALLCVFAAATFLDRGPRLLAAGGVPGVIGSSLCVAGLLLMLAAFASIRGMIQIAPEP